MPALIGFAHQWRQQAHECWQWERARAFTTSLSPLQLPQTPQRVPVCGMSCSHIVDMGCRHLKKAEGIFSLTRLWQTRLCFNWAETLLPMLWGQGSTLSQGAWWDNTTPLGDLTVPVCYVCKAAEDDGAAKIPFCWFIPTWDIYLQGSTSV